MKKIGLLLFILAISAVSAFPQTLNVILKRMVLNQKTLKSLRADISINKSSSQTGEKTYKEGTVRFMPIKNDYLLRIDSTKPAPENFSIFNNQYVLYMPNPNPLYLPGSKVAFAGTTTDEQKNLLFIFSNLLIHPVEKWKFDYLIKYFGEEKVKGTTPAWHLELMPKNPQDYKTVELWVNGDGMIIQSKFIKDKNDWIIVGLSNLQKNVSLNPAEFKIDLPKELKIFKN